MPWRVQWTDRAVKDLSRLDPPVARRIIRKLDSSLDDPKRSFQRLQESDVWKLRIGDFRLLVISPKESRIFVQSVKHRSQAYRK